MFRFLQLKTVPVFNYCSWGVARQSSLLRQGPGKTQVRQFIHRHRGSHIMTQPTNSAGVSIRVVAALPSSWFGSRIVGKLRQRLGYSNKKVTLSTRPAIFKATTWPTLLYNSGTWPRFGVVVCFDSTACCCDSYPHPTRSSSVQTATSPSRTCPLLRCFAR